MPPLDSPGALDLPRFWGSSEKSKILKISEMFVAGGDKQKISEMFSRMPLSPHHLYIFLAVCAAARSLALVALPTLVELLNSRGQARPT